MGKPTGDDRKGRKRKRGDRPRSGPDPKSGRKEPEAPRGKEAVRAHGVSERVAAALVVLALFQCLLIVLLAMVVSFDWLRESSAGGDALSAGDVAPVVVRPNTSSPVPSAMRGPSLGDSPLYLSPYDATELVKSAASLIGRFPVDSISDTHSLRDVDVNTPQRVEHVKGLLRLSIEANVDGSLDAPSFMDTLQLTPGNTMAAAGDRLVTAYQVAWSPDSPD